MGILYRDVNVMLHIAISYVCKCTLHAHILQSVVDEITFSVRMSSLPQLQANRRGERVDVTICWWKRKSIEPCAGLPKPWHTFTKFSGRVFTENFRSSTFFSSYFWEIRTDYQFIPRSTPKLATLMNTWTQKRRNS